MQMFLSQLTSTVEILKYFLNKNFNLLTQNQQVILLLVHKHTFEKILKQHSHIHASIHKDRPEPVLLQRY